MTAQEKAIRTCIDIRKAANQLTPCTFLITVPKISGKFREDGAIKKIEAMLGRNGVDFGYVDTAPGSFNLNRDWIETDPIACAVEYGGAYPADWNIADAAELARMDADGEIIILVQQIIGGQRVPNG